MSLYNTYGIYAIKNKVNNFVYVGKTVNSFGDRWDCHKAQLRGGYNGNNPLQDDWNKYGENSFEFIVLLDCTGKTLDYVNKREIETIAYYKSRNRAYNLHDGGDSSYNLGKHLSEETKRKIGEKNRQNMTGKRASQKTKEKMSESQKRRYANWTDEDRKQYGKMMKERFKEHPKSEEAKRKISEAQKDNKNGAKYTPEMVLKMRYMYEKENMTVRQISNYFGICYGTVDGIVKYRRWKNLKAE